MCIKSTLRTTYLFLKDLLDWASVNLRRSPILLSDLENLNYFVRKAFSLADNDEMLEAKKVLRRAHVFVHRKAGLHFKLHLKWLRLAMRHHEFVTACVQFFAIITALPASFFQRLVMQSVSRQQVSEEV